ncbi:PTS system N-acetylglucosamine-specific EIICBA component [Candidatus Hepatincola sp. Pdp]
MNKKYLYKFFDYLQLIGRALWLPIAVLPAAGLLLRLGQPDLLDLPFLAKAGGAIFENLGLLFAIGIAGGLATDKHVSAGISGAIVFLVMQGAMLTLSKDNNMGTLGGIIAGITAGVLYNKFHTVKLPVYLAFFGGRRFVPIVSGLSAIVLATIFGYIWPIINTGIKELSNWILNSGAFGLFIYGLSNRILLPTGLQHITEAIAYFVLGNYTSIDGTVVTGDLNRFFARDPSAGIFMAGFFPVMVFGLPAAALAMYHCAKKEKKAIALGILLSAALTSMLTGVTEPIEFPILFAAPLLYGVHAVLMGSSYVITYLVGYKAGFSFSGGMIDMLLSWGISTKPWLIFILGPIYFVIYYVVFYSLIKLFNLKTPGREDDSLDESTVINAIPSSYDEKAIQYMAALGGKENILVLENCVSRLRLKLANINQIDEQKIKLLGAKGVIKLDNSLQIVIGTDVEFLATAMEKLRK